MKTDLPLKRVTRLCPADVLALAGIRRTTVVDVETLELPASKASLDTVVRLLGEDGAERLHLIEWQGYADPRFLWRVLGYLGWLGQNREERPICVTVIYLTPADDTGSAIDQAGGWRVSFSCVRLWEQDALAALASGQPGLVALSPLMAGATPELVEAAAAQLLAAPPPVQGELLAALGIFAQPISDAERFVRLVRKERLMATDLIAYLTQELQEEHARKIADMEEELGRRTAELTSDLQQSIDDVIAVRFPAAHLQIAPRLRRISDTERLRTLRALALRATDAASVEAAIDEALAQQGAPPAAS